MITNFTRTENHILHNKPTTHKEREGKERGQAEDNRTSNESRCKRTRKRTRKRTKEDKIEANTPQASKPPNTSRAQKPHKPRKTPNLYKYTPTPQNPLKTPLKREIEPYLQATRQAQCSKADKRHGTYHQRTRANLWQVRQVLNPAHMPPVDTTTKGAHDTPHQHHISKIY